MSNTKPITYKNKTYSSIAKLASTYNIPDDVLRSRLSDGWSVEKAITKPVINKKIQPITYKNKTYNSIAALAKEYNISYKLLRDRLIRNKWSVDKAINTPVGIIYKNKIYNSLKELCREKNLPYENIYYRIKKQKWSIEKAIKTPIKTITPKTVTYQNKTYSSIKKLAKEQNINYYLLKDRINKQKWSIEDAVETPTDINKGQKIIYKNKTYNSIAKLAKEYNIRPQLLRSRINDLNWSVDKAINTPTQQHLPKGFKTVKLAYTHNNTDYYECIYNNQKYILSIQEMYTLKENNNAVKNL